jgi:hypothetical protein
VGLALDHVVANMFLVPMGDLEWGAVAVEYYTWKSLIPRNMVGGGLFVGDVYWYLYLSGEGDVGASFEVGAVPFGKRVVQLGGRRASREILLLVC